MKSSSIMNSLYKLRSSSKTSKSRTGRRLHSVLAVITGLMTLSFSAVAQQTSPQRSDEVTVWGAVHSSDGKPVNDAVVRLEHEGVPGAVETKTNAAGDFVFLALRTGSYLLNAEKAGLRSPSAAVVVPSQRDQEKIDLVLEDSGSTHSDFSTSSLSTIQTMTFADKPSFSIAGVTDWTAVGGHGSDSSLRTSEALASETLTLKSTSPEHSAARVTGDTDEANRHRLVGELDEKSGDPLGAVHEYEQAVHLDPSEQNYFEWGSELLLHRAILQAQEVFHKGVETYPRSVRMLTGLGAALFAGARYDEAALRLCNASDLNPTDPEPYIFMGKIEIAAPNTLACIEQKLARFVQEQPENSLANYFYAMALLKRQQQPPNRQVTQEAERLFTKAATIDDKCGDAYLQLGILSASALDFEKAIGFYMKAVEADPQLGEAHYRLGMVYDRMGESAKAKQEFQLHDEIKKQQAETIERQRREVKQFLVVLPEHPPTP
jgi:tetratricopeptide (TPR) repeat protein